MYGLNVDENGRILLGGKEFYAMGVNFHGAFCYTELPVAFGHKGFYTLDDTLKPIADAGIPFMRSMVGEFYANGVDRYLKTPEKYFEAMDRFFEKCTQYRIGVVASLMWNLDTFCNYYGEDVTALLNPESKASKLAVKYVKDVAARYKNCPSLWAYEVGNEGNLGADLKCLDPKHSNLTTEVLTAYYKMIGEAIREIDPDRIIVGGDSEPRPVSRSLREGKGWRDPDTYEDTKDAIAFYTPSPLNCVSVHTYNEAPEGKGIRNYGEAIEKYYKAAKELKIGFFVGEFGPGAACFGPNLNDEIGPEDPREKHERDNFYAAIDGIVNNGVQLSAVWCYHRTEQEDGTAILPGVRNNYQWETVVELNKKYGNSDIVNNYWNNY